MFPINYLPPERMPAHQRDFPREGQGLQDIQDSKTLGLMVAWYLIAMFAGIMLLGYLTAPVVPSTGTAGAAETLKK